MFELDLTKKLNNFLVFLLPIFAFQFLLSGFLKLRFSTEENYVFYISGMGKIYNKIAGSNLINFSKTMSDYTVDEGESDMAMLSLNIEADLSSIFNWNVKQLYVYLVAEYSTTKNVCFGCFLLFFKFKVLLIIIV